MDDKKTTVQQLKEAVDAMIAEREWHQFHNPKNLSMSIACEAAELMEHFIWVETKDSLTEFKKYKDEVGQELADVIIAALMFANVCDVDVATAVLNKLEITKKKYPVEKAKGRSTKYTKYEQ